MLSGSAAEAAGIQGPGQESPKIMGKRFSLGETGIFDFGAERVEDWKWEYLRDGEKKRDFITPVYDRDPGGIIWASQGVSEYFNARSEVFSAQLLLN